MTVLLTCFLAGTTLALGGTTLALWRARSRTYDYAKRQAEQYADFDPVGWAYSDMATVIVLDGDAPWRPPIIWLPTDGYVGTPKNPNRGGS